MSCQRVVSMLSAYIDGEVHGQDANLVKQHLEQCASCAQELKVLQRTTEVLRAVPEVEPPASLMEQIEAATVKRVGLLARLQRAFDYMPGYTRWAAGTVAAAAVLMGILVSQTGDVRAPGKAESPVAKVQEIAPTAPAKPFPSVEMPSEAPSEMAVVVTERPSRRVRVEPTRPGERPMLAAVEDKAAGTEETIELAMTGDAALVNEGGEIAKDVPATDDDFAEVAAASPGRNAAASVPEEPAPPTAAKAEVTEVARDTTVPEEPGAMGQLRAKLSVKDRQKFDDTHVERVEGKKYSIELVSFRF